MTASRRSRGATGLGVPASVLALALAACGGTGDEAVPAPVVLPPAAATAEPAPASADAPSPPEPIRSDSAPGRQGPGPGDLLVSDAATLADRADPRMTVNLFEAPGEVAGMDPVVLERIDSLVLAALADSAAPGAALAIGRYGRLVRLRGYGTLDWERQRLVTPATIYDLASLTKVIGTTTAVMILDEEGRLDLDAPVVRYLPWWSGGHRAKEPVTVRQLLLHRAGLPPFRRWFVDIEGKEAYRSAIAAEPLEYRPGSRTTYSDIGVMTLAFVVEAVSGLPLDDFLQQRVFGPLGMEDTGFLPAPALRPRIAPTEVDTLWRHTHVHGVVHDENADAIGGVAGHAGLFSTAWDLAVFAGMMRAGGVVPPCEPTVGDGRICTRARPDSVRILQAGTVARYTRRYDGEATRALGWDTPSGRSSAGDYFTSRAFGHTGFTGTSIWIDPELDLFVVLLTNRVNPTRDNSRHVPLRRAVHDLAAMAITDRVVTPREPAGGPGGPDRR